MAWKILRTRAHHTQASLEQHFQRSRKRATLKQIAFQVHDLRYVSPTRAVGAAEIAQLETKWRCRYTTYAMSVQRELWVFLRTIILLGSILWRRPRL